MPRWLPSTIGSSGKKTATASATPPAVSSKKQKGVWKSSGNARCVSNVQSRRTHPASAVRPKSHRFSRRDVGRPTLPAAGLPAGWTRWKAGPQAKACPTIQAHTRYSACRTTLARGGLVRFFRDGEDLVGGNVVQSLMDAAGPSDIDLPDHFRAAEAKVHAWIA